MGLCNSRSSQSPDPEARQRDKEITKRLRADGRKADSEIKLLLLGAGESGKSTIFKQMKIIHHKGYNPDECMRFKDVIYGNTIQSIRALVNAANKMNLQMDKPENKARADKIAAIPEQQIILNAGSLLTPEMGREIKLLWEDKAIQTAYSRRNEFQLNDSAGYYLNAIERLCDPGYAPSQQDVLRSRVKTVGIVEAEFMIDGYKFRMVDVGGQRNERRKWIHVFDDVTAIIFVTSLSEFDQKLFEDDNMNRMRESLLLFDEICNCRYFRSTSIIIFFNKKDLFEEKIKRVDLKCCFPDYPGGKNYDNAVKFIQQKFLETNKSRARQIYTHVTCATDTENIRVVFDAVKNIILHDNLRDANLI
eukprot:GEZU01032422.1.p1 GENE.GEZU01032422.1~~GEZU01032422.1.p1  ORF type:complete len:362 (+),score=94.00 GEZU01032422.1:268-1353(+)